MKNSRLNSRSFLQALLTKLKSIFFPKPEPEDPYAYRTAPLRHPPNSRSGAAVAELDEE